MYSEKERARLCQQIVDFMCENVEFEGLLQIGSGAVGYSDIYSDIDLMAGCFSEECVNEAKRKLQILFSRMNAVYTDERAWSDTALGLSVYFENGLSADISFLPTKQLRIRSSQWKLIFSKTAEFRDIVQENAKIFERQTSKYGIDDSIHHRFVYALRKAVIALRREEWVYADIMISEARQMLLSIEVVREGKKLHQFKAYNTLNPEFLKYLENTYPIQLDGSAFLRAEKSLLALYLDTVEKCDFLSFDNTQLKLLQCYKEHLE